MLWELSLKAIWTTISVPIYGSSSSSIYITVVDLSFNNFDIWTLVVEMHALNVRKQGGKKKKKQFRDQGMKTYNYIKLCRLERILSSMILFKKNAFKIEMRSAFLGIILCTEIRAWKKKF